MANGILMSGQPLGALDASYISQARQSPIGEPADPYRAMADALRFQEAQATSEIDRIKGSKLGQFVNALGAFGAGIQGRDPSQFTLQGRLDPWQEQQRRAQLGIAQTGLQRQQAEQEAARLQARAAQGDPAAVREYQYFASLPEDQQAQYLQVKRSTIEKVGDQLFQTAGARPEALLTRDQLQALAEQQGLEVREKEVAKGDVKSQIAAEDRRRQDAAALNLYETASEGLQEALAGTATGPVSGRLPAVTSEAQIAEGAVAAMAPILKSLFRTAGEGTFTDKDQELLTSMLPTRTDSPKAIQAKLDNVDRIVKAKLSGAKESVQELRGGTDTETQAEPSIDDLIKKYGG